MKKNISFSQSFGQYLRRRGHVFAPWGYPLVAGTLIAVLIVSLPGYVQTPTLFGIVNARTLTQLARRGDYETARRLLSLRTAGEHVLGAASELDEIIFPERRVEAEIQAYTTLAERYPDSRDILYHLARLYQTVGAYGDATARVQADRYWEQARRLDPNNPRFENVHQ